MSTTNKEAIAAVDTLDYGEDADLSELFSAAYTVLRTLAHAQRLRWYGQETMGTTALVHEAYLKLSRQGSTRWGGRGHFFRVAARAMRHILIDYAERSRTAKRGGHSLHVRAEETQLVDESRIEDLLALHEALTRLERRNPRQAWVVECRFFAGLDVEETAEALDVSPTTVKRDWRRAQAWLFRQLEGDRAPAAGMVGKSIATTGADDSARGE